MDLTPRDWLNQYEHGYGRVDEQQRNETGSNRVELQVYPEPLMYQFRYLLLAIYGKKQQASSREWSNILEGMRPIRGYAVGALGLPMGYYLDLTDAMREVGQSQTPNRYVQEALLPFLFAFNSAFKTARANKYQWERMALSFHPFEPDILGVLQLVKPRLRWLSEWIQTLPLDRNVSKLVVAFMTKDE